MKTRIVILISFVLMIVACQKDVLPPPEPPTPHPDLMLDSPDPLVEYGAGAAIAIKGNITDPEIIKSLSIMVYSNTSAKDTLFQTTRPIESLSCAINESWTPSTLDFAGGTNTYLLEIKITHESTSTQPSLSFFQEIHAYK